MQGRSLDPAAPQADGSPAPPPGKSTVSSPAERLTPQRRQGASSRGSRRSKHSTSGAEHNGRKRPSLSDGLAWRSFPQPPVPAEQFLVLFSPGIASPVERVAVPFHPRLVSIINARNPRKTILQGYRQLHTLPRTRALFPGQGMGCLPFPPMSSRRFPSQNGQGPFRIMRAEGIH